MIIGFACVMLTLAMLKWHSTGTGFGEVSTGFSFLSGLVAALTVWFAKRIPLLKDLTRLVNQPDDPNAHGAVAESADNAGRSMVRTLRDAISAVPVGGG